MAGKVCVVPDYSGLIQPCLQPKHAKQKREQCFSRWQEHIEIQKTCSNTHGNMLFHSYSFSLSSSFFINRGKKSYRRPLISSSSSSLPLLPSSLFPLALAQTRSHLWWGGVLYSINSRLHAKIHYASLLFLRTQACQLTCGTNFPPTTSLHPPTPLIYTAPLPPPTPANKYV